jgi:hypothetical protein
MVRSLHFAKISLALNQVTPKRARMLQGRCVILKKFLEFPLIAVLITACGT